jgi:transcriptional regulator with XRE-family HTH domain
MDVKTLGRNIARLRKKMGAGLRELSRKAGMSAASLSAIEKGESSPTIATLYKVLKALDTDFAEFFSSGAGADASPVFRARDMQQIEDAVHRCVFLFPRRGDIRFEMFRENLAPSTTKREWEVYDFDVGGTVLSGGPLRIEIENAGVFTIKKGDAFHIRRGLRHCVTNAGRRAVEMITVVTPPRY